MIRFMEEKTKAWDVPLFQSPLLPCGERQISDSDLHASPAHHWACEGRVSNAYSTCKVVCIRNHGFGDMLWLGLLFFLRPVQEMRKKDPKDPWKGCPRKTPN